MTVKKGYDKNSWDSITSQIMSELKNAAESSLAYRDETRKSDSAYRTEMKEAMAKLQASVDYTNGRVTKLERGAWQQKGFIAATVILGGALWRLIWLHFFGT